MPTPRSTSCARRAARSRPTTSCFEDGRIVQMVPESRRAWHAGSAFWAGETDINSCSIGIEIANPGHEFGYPDFPKAPDRGGDSALPRHPHAQHRSGRSACSRIPTSRRRASRTPARNFPGARLSIQASGIGSSPRRSPRAAMLRARRQRRSGVALQEHARRVRLRHRHSAASTTPPRHDVGHGVPTPFPPRARRRRRR